MNKIILCGNLTRDFETGSTGFSNYARAGLAVNRPFSKKNEVDFFNLVAFGKTADICAKYTSKGQKVVVEGRIQFETYTDKNGNSRVGHSVVIENLEFSGNSAKPSNENIYTPPEDDEVGLPF